MADAAPDLPVSPLVALSGVTRYIARVRARRGAQAGWIRGDARPQATQRGLILRETGTFTPETAGTPWATHGAWRFQETPGGLTVEHLRLGAQNPVRLLTLVPARRGRWACLAPYRCGEDLYRMALRVEAGAVRTLWTASGPRKAWAVAARYDRGPAHECRGFSAP